MLFYGTKWYFSDEWQNSSSGTFLVLLDCHHFSICLDASLSLSLFLSHMHAHICAFSLCLCIGIIFFTCANAPLQKEIQEKGPEIIN